jgi:hypothetical protein
MKHPGDVLAVGVCPLILEQRAERLDRQHIDSKWLSLPPQSDCRQQRRGTDRGTSGRKIQVESVLPALSAVLFMQVAALWRARVPLVKRRQHAQDQWSGGGGGPATFRFSGKPSYHALSRRDVSVGWPGHISGIINTQNRQSASASRSPGAGVTASPASLSVMPRWLGTVPREGDRTLARRHVPHLPFTV